ncbi:hypothetical protein FHX34_105717 [Actinoplanes teichomyceticus]|uniref:Uncharacterized protein n=1 Tax=Actinoplanes teichomyceticus TaxID=1867 RepID=A0A561VMK4_ACTTI|nr:hypothetical protein FHX34_105717 [Actinoplanes teichomyceticus]
MWLQSVPGLTPSSFAIAVTLASGAGRPSWTAMSSDESRPSSIRRPRAVGKRCSSRGPVKDLRDAVYRSYAEADRPQLAELAERIAFLACGTTRWWMA